MAKHTDDYYIKRIKKILWDNYYFFSWTSTRDRGVYLTSKHLTDWIRWFEDRSYESLYEKLKSLSLLWILKLKAISIWKWYDDTYWYATEKINEVNRIMLHCDAYIIWNMFDIFNQKKLLEHLTDDEIELIWKNNINPLIDLIQ